MAAAEGEFDKASGDPLYASEVNNFERRPQFKAIKFGGDGSDGALNITSGTTTIDTSGGDEYKQYSSINISAGATLSKTQDGGNLYIFCKGDCVIDGDIDLDAKGYSGGAVDADGSGANIWLSNYNTFIGIARGGYRGASVSGGAGGGGGGAGWSNGTNAAYSTSPGYGGSAYPTWSWMNEYSPLRKIGCGTGGGGGADNPGVGGAGGKGAGSIYLEVYGDLTYGAASVITADGENGANATGTNAGGGGGGGGGLVFVLYHGTLTDNGVSVTTTGGTGGTKVGSASNGGAGGAGNYVISQVV